MEKNRIHLLSERVTNKIAAGEVVERPASVLKELIENSIDAGAKSVDVEIVEGGRCLLSVIDDGYGMNEEDALLSIQRYATSKIDDVDDIESIATMGFRGEALAAISSVSRFRLVSRTADSDSATEVVVSGGKIQSVEKVGAPVGTNIEVRNMFFNVPARRKFMRTARTELSHIRQRFLVYSIAYPGIGFTLRSDDSPIYSLTAGDSMLDRIQRIYGESVASALKEVDHESNGVSVGGFAALPRVARTDRSDQYIFVNGRPATAPVLGYAIKEGYHTLLPSGKHPVLFLFVSTDPKMVDVNVHPTKREVRFRNNHSIRDAVISALKGALSNKSPGMDATARHDGIAARSFKQVDNLQIEDIPQAPVFRYPRMPMFEDARDRAPENSPADANSEDEGALDDGGQPWSECRILGVVGGMFVVLDTDDGMVLMDPHAAHERVMYEKFMDEALKGAVRSQGLLYPESIEMSPENADVIRKNESSLQDMGFGISSFGGDSFIVDAVPSCLGEVAVANVIEQLGKALERGGRRASMEHGLQERIAMAACKAAVKAGRPLTLEEIERLVVDLARSKMPYTCPHGRPTIIFMSWRELQRKFGRIT